MFTANIIIERHENIYYAIMRGNNNINDIVAHGNSIKEVKHNIERILSLNIKDITFTYSYQ